jgi:hypothetical protein
MGEFEKDLDVQINTAFDQGNEVELYETLLAKVVM